MSDYKAAKVTKGASGWGGPLVIRPEDDQKYIVSVTGGGIHPVAQEIADKTGGIAIDGFENPVEKEEMACVVINCGGTSRSGVYPKMGVLTVNVFSNSRSGPLAKFIKETNFVSGVTMGNVESAGSEDESHTDDMDDGTEENEQEAKGSLLDKDVAKETKEEAKQKVASKEKSDG